MGRLLALGLLGIALALLGERLLALRNRLKASREVESVDLPNCHLIKGIEAGAEDIDILPNGLAFFSVANVMDLSILMGSIFLEKEESNFGTSLVV